tara:strand:- start:62 stop:304 length:243 start_codon:yes stop_codon:yes gene_type:complete
MAVIPIVVFHDRALLQKDKDWAYATECSIAWVDDEDLVTNDDQLKNQKDFDDTMVLDIKKMLDVLQDGPSKKNNDGFFIL